MAVLLVQSHTSKGVLHASNLFHRHASLCGASRPVGRTYDNLCGRLLDLGTRHASTWRLVPQLSNTRDTITTFRNEALTPGRPTVLRNHAVPVNAHGTWLTGPASQPTLDFVYLRRHADTLYLPMELTVPSKDTFHRTESAPLSLFLDALEASSSSSSSPDPTITPSLYIAQCPLTRLPPPLASAFPIPDLVLCAGAGDVYASSLWLGLPPTATPLHRDPNPNLFVQVAGQKVVRLMSPDIGSEVFRQVKRDVGAGFGADGRVRGEEMMKGPEMRGLEGAVWGDDESQRPGDNGSKKTGEGSEEWYEAKLQPGDALFIPQGWWHAVRGVGEGINMSVNWWFR